MPIVAIFVFSHQSFENFSRKYRRSRAALGAMRGSRPSRVLLPLSNDTSNGPVLLARRRLVAGGRSGWPGRSRRSMMMQRGRRPSRRWRRMRSVGCIISFFAAGRWRGRSVLLLLQQLSKLLDRLVQGPQLREQREVELPQPKHFSPEHCQLGIQGGELSGRWRWPR